LSNLITSAARIRYDQRVNITVSVEIENVGSRAGDEVDVIGIDLGITLLGAENGRTGNVWRWFMRNPEIPKAMELVELQKYSRQRRQTRTQLRKAA